MQHRDTYHLEGFVQSRKVNRLFNKEQVQPRTRRVVFIAGPGTEILDLVGPLQVFARAAEIFGKQNPGSPPIYSVEVVTTSAHRSFITDGGLHVTAHRNYGQCLLTIAPLR